MNLPNRMDAVQSPVIPIVGQLTAENPGTVSLGQGVAFYGPPPSAIEAMTQALSDDALHQYKAVGGIPYPSS